MDVCTDHAGSWPDSTDDVAQERLGEYLNHAETCQYHAKRLRAEDERLESIFRTARGLDSEAAFFSEAEFERAIKDHKQRRTLWRTESVNKEVPFTHLVLRNAGTEIACCGDFFGSETHQGSHWLDVEAGLQIFGIVEADPSAEVLLGFYPLANVQHDGEQFLRLDNGYVVALEVMELGLHMFHIQFRYLSDCEYSIWELHAAGAVERTSLVAGLTARQSTKTVDSVISHIRNVYAKFGAQMRHYLTLLRGRKALNVNKQDRQRGANRKRVLTREDRFYAFIVARTSRSRATVRRICIHKRWLQASACGLFFVLCGLMYGFYGLTQQATHLRIERENQRLRVENDKQRQALTNLNKRVGPNQTALTYLREAQRAGIDRADSQEIEVLIRRLEIKESLQKQ